MSRRTHKIILAILGITILGTSVAVASSQNRNASIIDNGNSIEKTPICDGRTVTKFCEDEQGVKYEKYLWHDAVPAAKKEVQHPAEPEKSHTVYHEAVYGTRQIKDCIRTSINYKSGTCALSQCRDGSYSGSSGRGTCSHHGGVAKSGGPWYTYREESYVIKPAWTETIIDQPAKEAWTETIIITPETKAYLEKIPIS